MDKWLDINESAGDEEQTSWSRMTSGFKGDLKTNTFFLTTFGTAISALMPVVNSLIANMPNIADVEINRQTIGLLTVCAVAIVVGEDKAVYKKWFEELRLRGVYGIFSMFLKLLLLQEKILKYKNHIINIENYKYINCVLNFKKLYSY